MCSSSSSSKKDNNSIPHEGQWTEKPFLSRGTGSTMNQGLVVVSVVVLSVVSVVVVVVSVVVVIVVVVVVVVVVQGSSSSSSISSSSSSSSSSNSSGFVKVVVVVVELVVVVEVAVVVVGVHWCCSIRFGSRSARPTDALAYDDESMDHACGVIKRFQTGFYSMVIVTTCGRRLALVIRSHTLAIPCGVATPQTKLHIFPVAVCSNIADEGV